jgi:hypothetical protein
MHALEDGIAVPFTVKSQQGADVTWNVTVNVQPGISFTYDSTRVVLTAGYEDQNAAYTPAQVGNGQPVGYYDGLSFTYADAYAAIKQIPWDDTTQEMASVGMIGQSTGTYSADQDVYFEYFEPNSALNLLANTGMTIAVTTYGAPGGYFEGTFSGAAGDNAQTPALHPITNGFFKGLVVADSTPFLGGGSE